MMARRAIPWQALLHLLIAISAGAFLMDAFAHPYVIQDDARQFQSWMLRILDPGAMSNDLIADYWQSVSPPLYRGIYQVLAALGIAPLVAARLLPVPLLFVTAWFAWRVSSRLVERPSVAFFMAAATMAMLIHTDSIFSATPRAFMAPLFLMFIDGLLRGRKFVALLGLLLMAAIYPAPAIVCLVILGLTHLRWSPRLRIDLSRNSIPYLLGTILLVGCVVLPFRGETARWAPTLTLAEARTMPNLTSPKGRSSIVGRDSRIGWVCSPRIGFLPMVVNCRSNYDPRLLINFALFILPASLLFMRALRSAPAAGIDKDIQSRSLIYGYAILAALFCYLSAALLAFKLHLPSRYSQMELGILGMLASAQFIAPWVSSKLENIRGTPLVIAQVFAAACIVFVFSTPYTNLVRPADSQLITHIEKLPASVRIAGISTDLNFVPALTGRAVLATTEHAIPYQLGYFRPFSEQLAASIDVATTGDFKQFSDLVAKYRIDVIAVDRELLTSGTMPRTYLSLVPDAVNLKPGATSVVAAAISQCQIYSGRATVMLDSACIISAHPTLHGGDGF